MGLKPVGGVPPHSFRGEGGAIGAGLAVMAGTAKDQVKLPTGAGVRAVGVTANKTSAADEPVGVVSLGELVGIAGGAITRGDPVEVGGTDGRLTAAAPAAGVNADIVGFALETAAADGDEFLLHVAPGRIQGA